MHGVWIYIKSKQDMKIRYENYPLLDIDKRNNLPTIENIREELAKFDVQLPNEDVKGFQSFIEILKTNKNISIQLVTEKISEFLFDNANDLIPKMWKFLHEFPDKYGIILWRSFTYMYYKTHDEKSKKVIIYWFVFNGTDDIKMVPGITCKYMGDDTYISGTFSDTNQLAMVGLMITVLYLLFIEFAELETVTFNSRNNHKVKLNNDKYWTDVPYDIEIIDSNWFRTLIRTGAFSVSGHFRLQPYGKQRLQRRLQWISEFQKHGYIRKAKILINNENKA